MRMPISKPGEARFRGPTSSNQYNKQEDDKYYDLIELYKQSNENYKKLKEAYETILSEHVMLQHYTRILENEINSLEKRLDILSNEQHFYNGRFFKTGFSNEMRTTFLSKDQDENTNEERAELDKEYRFATLPLANVIPKTHILDTNNQIVLPEELEVNIIRANEGGEINENSVLNAFDGNKNTYWKREVIYDKVDAPSFEDVQLEISLPVNLMNNLDVNTIFVNPHPERGIEITNVEIHYNNTWQQIESFYQNEFTKNMFPSPRRKWYFPKKPVQKVRVTLTQRNPITIGGKKIFVLGAQEIGVYLTSFKSTSGIVLTPIDMSDVGVYSIDKVEHIITNEHALSFSSELDQLEGNIYDYTIMQEIDDMLVPIDESQWTNQIHPRLWIKTTLYQDKNNGITPCLHGVRLHYTKV